MKKYETKRIYERRNMLKMTINDEIDMLIETTILIEIEFYQILHMFLFKFS